MSQQRGRAVQFSHLTLRPPRNSFLLARNLRPALRSKNGAISVHIRLVVALRVLAGDSYMDVGLIYGVAFQSVYSILWDVVDAINKTPTVGPFRLPQTEADCKKSADKWQVCGTCTSTFETRVLTCCETHFSVGSS